MQSPDPFVLALQNWVGMFMHRSMRDSIRFAKENGLSMSQVGAMFHIRHGVDGVSDIGDDLGVTSAAASQMLERLVQAGLVTRTEDPHDRRAKQGTELLDIHREKLLAGSEKFGLFLF